MDKIIEAIHQQLILSYTQAGRVVPTTVGVVAAALQDALQFSSVEEVHNAFRKARDMADVPTQRVLKEALTNYRQENLPQPRVYAIEDNRPGKKLATNEETGYMMATQTLCDIYFGMDKETARAIVERFEADPKNAECVAYQRAWLKKNMKHYREQLARIMVAKNART